MKKTAIIVAGGKGERMQSATPKQFIKIQGMPILMHTIRAFYRYDQSMDIIVVLPATQIEHWHTLCSRHSFTLPHRTTQGGETRFHSVKNGLRLADSDSLIAVHDGVRPFVSTETLARCFECAEANGTAVPVTPPVDSIRRVTDTGNHACDRSEYRLVQTPQVFNGILLHQAYEQEFSPSFTDDASVVEAQGYSIQLVEGNRENIKITTAFDLQLAEVLFSYELRATSHNSETFYIPRPLVARSS